MINIDNIEFKYYKGNHSVFSDFSLKLEGGRIYGLLGKNGTGKTTLLHLITGLSYPHNGEVTINGVDSSKRVPELMSDIFFLTEEFYLPKMSLREYIDLNSPFYPKFSFSDMKSHLNEFEMNDDKINLGRLSMGQRKKVIISFALATNTSLLIMDEPTNGLDIPAKSQFRKVVGSSMKDDRTIIISTHQVRDLDSLIENVVIIEPNKVLLNSSCVEITDKLMFAEVQVSEKLPADILLLQSTPYGNRIVVENKEGADTPLDMEMLFNCVISQPERITAIFNR